MAAASCEMGSITPVGYTLLGYWQHPTGPTGHSSCSTRTHGRRGTPRRTSWRHSSCVGGHMTSSVLCSSRTSTASMAPPTVPPLPPAPSVTLSAPPLVRRAAALGLPCSSGVPTAGAVLLLLLCLAPADSKTLSASQSSTKAAPMPHVCTAMHQSSTAAPEQNGRLSQERVDAWLVFRAAFGAGDDVALKR